VVDLAEPDPTTLLRNTDSLRDFHTDTPVAFRRYRAPIKYSHDTIEATRWDRTVELPNGA